MGQRTPEIQINQIESGRLAVGFENIAPLIKRFGGNGLTPEILVKLGMDKNDAIQLSQLSRIEQTADGSIAMDFQPAGTENMSVPDRLAQLVNRIQVNPDRSSPFGWKTSTEVAIAESDPFSSSTVFFSLAQLLGHTLTMKGLTEAMVKNHQAESLEFAVPTPDNLTTIGDWFQTGRAMIWRQLFEPGYVNDPNLVFPMNPFDNNFNQTLALTGAINRHILALACNALAHGHDLCLFNDARHEGPVLFKLISDWAQENQPDGHLHTFHMAYLLLDSQNHLPDWVKTNMVQSQTLLEQAARKFFPGVSVADGVEFMSWKMLIQILLQQEVEQNFNIQHHLLFQTSLDPNQLTLERVPDQLKPWFKAAKITAIPEVAASAEAIRPGVNRLAVSLGGSGHSEAGQLILELADLCNRDGLTVDLLGKGTNQETVAKILGGRIPNGLNCRGFIEKSAHDDLLTQADVIIIKTSRNSREAIDEAVWHGQGVVLLPPETPTEVEPDIDLFKLSFLRETLAEHGHDLMLAIKNLTDLGIKEQSAKNCVWQPNSQTAFKDLADQALKAVQSRRGALIPPQQLADIVMQIVSESGAK